MATVRLTADARTAFLELGNGRTGIVHTIGDCFLTRIVTASDIVALDVDDRGAILLKLADFTWKGGRFVFADRTDSESIAAALRNLDQAREAA